MSAIDAIAAILGLLVVVGVFALLFWALRRHNRMYPKGRDRISRDPEAAQATRRFGDDVDLLLGARRRPLARRPTA